MRVAKSVTVSYACETCEQSGLPAACRPQATTHRLYGIPVSINQAMLCPSCPDVHIRTIMYVSGSRSAFLTTAKLAQRIAQSQEFVDSIYAFKTTQFKR